MRHWRTSCCGSRRSSACGRPSLGNRTATTRLGSTVRHRPALNVRAAVTHDLDRAQKRGQMMHVLPYMSLVRIADASSLQALVTMSIEGLVSEADT